VDLESPEGRQFIEYLQRVQSEAPPVLKFADGEPAAAPDATQYVFSTISPTHFSALVIQFWCLSTPQVRWCEPDREDADTEEGLSSAQGDLSVPVYAVYGRIGLCVAHEGTHA